MAKRSTQLGSDSHRRTSVEKPAASASTYNRHCRSLCVAMAWSQMDITGKGRAYSGCNCVPCHDLRLERMAMRGCERAGQQFCRVLYREASSNEDTKAVIALEGFLLLSVNSAVSSAPNRRLSNDVGS